MKLLRHDLHFLTGAYALDALDGPERDRFEHHLHRCQSCSNEVRGLRETSTRLAFAVSRVPPVAMRQAVLTRASRTRQLPPVSEARRRPREPRAGWVLRPAFVLGVVALLVVVALSVLLAQTRHQLNTATAEQKAIAAVLAAPDARLVSATTNKVGLTTVVISRKLHQVIVTTTHLRTLPGNKVYQLWLLHAKKPTGLSARSAGLLPRAVAGQTAPVLASGLIRGDELGITVEPAGGTKQPTTKPFVVIKLYPKT